MGESEGSLGKASGRRSGWSGDQPDWSRVGRPRAELSQSEPSRQLLRRYFSLLDYAAGTQSGANQSLPLRHAVWTAEKNPLALR